MRKKFFIALVVAGAFLLSAVSARAQFTTVTATVKDTNGIPYAAGTMNAILVPSAPGGFRLSGQPYSGRVGPATLDSTGNFIANFGDVTLITPSAQWQITVDSNPGGIAPPFGTGSQTFTVTTSGTTISGSSVVDISATLSAAAPNLTNFTVSGVATVTGTAPIVSSGGANPAISCATCVTAASTFAQGQIPVATTNGTRGLATAGTLTYTANQLGVGFGAGTNTQLFLYNNANTATVLQPPGSGTSTTYIFPITAGTAGQVLSDNGGANPQQLTWITPSTVATAVPLSGITAATATNTIASGNNAPQIWNWALTSNNDAFTFGETTAATTGTLGNQYITEFETLAGSTAVPVGILNSLTGTQTLPALHVTPTWNTTGVVDAGILENVTNTASGAGSLLIDLQVGGTSQFNVDKAGNATGLGNVSAAAYRTATNCANAGGTCTSAAAGAVTVAAAATTVTVTTTAVTANSEILLQYDSSLGARLSVTCNTTASPLAVTARTAGTSFVVTVPAAPVTNPLCLNYSIVN